MQTLMLRTYATTKILTILSDLLLSRGTLSESAGSYVFQTTTNDGARIIVTGRPTRPGERLFSKMSVLVSNQARRGAGFVEVFSYDGHQNTSTNNLSERIADHLERAGQRDY